jgi:hypothetical protein
MTEKGQQPSAQQTATIYQFPVRAAQQAASQQRLQRTEALARSMADTPVSSGWYHDAAIVEAEREGRRH